VKGEKEEVQRTRVGGQLKRILTGVPALLPRGSGGWVPQGGRGQTTSEKSTVAFDRKSHCRHGQRGRKKRNKKEGGRGNRKKG